MSLPSYLRRAQEGKLYTKVRPVVMIFVGIDIPINFYYFHNQLALRRTSLAIINYLIPLSVEKSLVRTVVFGQETVLPLRYRCS